MSGNTAAFAATLDRAMTLLGMRNAALAQQIGVSREIVAHWRRGNCEPKPERQKLISQVLQLDEIHDQEAPPMLPISQWAKLYGVPVSRAKTLFDLEILSGAIRDNRGRVYLVPRDVAPPADSKARIRLLRRPAWIATMMVNLDCRMVEMGLSNIMVAEPVGVNPSAVTHWRTGRSYPLKERLPAIADALDWPLERLLQPPTAKDIANWRARNVNGRKTTAARVSRLLANIASEDAGLSA